MKDLAISIGIGFGLITAAVFGIFGATLLMCGLFLLGGFTG